MIYTRYTLIKRIEQYYQNLIVEDIKNPRNLALRKIFPWFLLGFAILQVVYYFKYFHNSIWRRIEYIKMFHEPAILAFPPKTVMFMYDYVLCFVLFLVLTFIVLTFGFIAFDMSQRNKVIRKFMNHGAL